MFLLLAFSMGLSFVGVIVCLYAGYSEDEKFYILAMFCAWFLAISIIFTCEEFKFQDYENSVEYRQYEVRIAEEKLQELQLNSKNP